MRTLYGDDEHSWYLQRVRDFTCRDCRVPRGATWCRNTFVTVGNCQIACCHVHADCLLFLRCIFWQRSKTPPGTQSAFSRPQRGISPCSRLSQASKPCDSPWKCSKLEVLRPHGWHQIWFNHWILKLTPIQKHGMTLDDRHRSRRIWDVLLCRVRGPEDTSPSSSNGWVLIPLQNISKPWDPPGDKHVRGRIMNHRLRGAILKFELSKMLWHMWHILPQVNRSIPHSRHVQSIVRLVTRIIPRFEWTAIKEKLCLDVLWSPTSPGHELHFGPADLVHLSIRSFEFHLARLFYLKVRQKK